MFIPCPQPKDQTPFTTALPIVWVSAGVIIDRDGRILITQRPAGKPMAGLWEFPGGKIENGETAEDALTRELMEELDIKTSPTCLTPLTFASHRYEKFHLMMTVYVCRNWAGMPVGKEGQNLKWVFPHELKNYPMPAADIPLISFIQNYV